MSRRSPEADDDQPGIADRLFAAVLAPIVFNISIVIILAVFFRRSRFIGRILVNDIPRIGGFLLFALLILPALIGFVAGTSRFITLLGHFFYTNMENEKDARITVAVRLACSSLPMSCRMHCKDSQQSDAMRCRVSALRSQFPGRPVQSDCDESKAAGLIWHHSRDSDKTEIL